MMIGGRSVEQDIVLPRFAFNDLICMSIIDITKPHNSKLRVLHAAPHSVRIKPLIRALAQVAAIIDLQMRRARSRSGCWDAWQELDF